MSQGSITPIRTDDRSQPANESASLISRSVLVIFCLAAGLAYRAIVGLWPASLIQAGVLFALSALFLMGAVLARRSQTLSQYWEIPFAFFVFTIAGIAGDQGGFIQQMFVRNVLHETASGNNPLAATMTGTVLAQLVSTLSIVLPILLLTKASGDDLNSIFVDKTKSWKWLIVALAGFLGIYLYVASGRAQRFFPNTGVTFSQYLALTPALVILVLCNGLREELWFRGLFLKKYGKFLGPWPSNILSAVIFATFHVQITYTPFLLPFLGISLILGLFFGYLMQKSGNLVASTIFHAGTDIPIFLVYLSYALP